jgi:hypothetical protein
MGCPSNRNRAVELFGEAANLDCPDAQREYGHYAFARSSWERYHWLGRGMKNICDARGFCWDVLTLFPWFENGQLGRALHTVGLVTRKKLVVPKHGRVTADEAAADPFASLHQVVALHEAMLGRARQAVDCWSVASRRLGLVKDLRVMIAKMVWEDAWCWSGKESGSAK